MTNRLKFRAWDPMAKEMSEIFTLRNLDSGYCIPFERALFAERSGDVDFIIMQSTGVFDKDGKEIFEGDIVKICYELDCGQYNKYGSTIEAVRWDILKAGFYPFTSWAGGTEYIVMGNIHKHSDLLLSSITLSKKIQKEKK